MTTLADLPDGWDIWSEEPAGRVVLAYRPDVFDGDAFPSACLPTISIAPGRSPDRPAGERERSEYWHVAFYLEPQVRIREAGSTHDDRSAAMDAAKDVAARFAAGEIGFRDAYQVPREAYLDELDDLVG